MNTLRVIFAGTPDFSVPSLRALFEHPDIEIVAVYTQPDRKAGRGQRVVQSPIKTFAVEHELPVQQPESFRDESHLEFCRALNADLLIVAAYGLILPEPVLSAVRYPLNVHASLLPRWRGAAPIQRAIMAGDANTGISIMRIVPELDAGPVWLSRSCPITDTDTGGTLHDRLATLGAKSLTEAINLWAEDAISEQPQDESKVTYAHKITAVDRNIEWAQPAKQIDRIVRALNPFPGTRFNMKDQTIKLVGGQICSIEDGHAAGEIVETNSNGIVFATSDAGYRITRLQPPGKKPMDASAFLNGYGRSLL